MKYSKELGFELPEATVRNFKRELGQQLKSGKDYVELDIPNRKRGRRPLLLPAELDDLTKQFIGSLRLCGSQVSSSIVNICTCWIVNIKIR